MSLPTNYKLIILDECRTLWGEPERVQLSNVHGAVACACVPTWSRCMCMTVSACHLNVTESIAWLEVLKTGSYWRCVQYNVCYSSNVGLQQKLTHSSSHVTFNRSHDLLQISAHPIVCLDCMSQWGKCLIPSAGQSSSHPLAIAEVAV